MNERPDGKPKERSLRVLVVEDDAGVGYAVCRWLKDQHVQTALAQTVHEAMDLIQDLLFIGSQFDGLLVDYNLPDATGMRVIHEFHSEFPALPVAVMSGANDISLEVWTKARHIPFFRKPLNTEEMVGWLEQIKLKLAS